MKTKSKMVIAVVLVVSGFFLGVEGIQAWGKEGVAEKETLSLNQAQGVVDRAVVPARRDLPTDTDNDGMPDVWEDNNGLDPYDPADAWFDADTDNVYNLFEYQLGYEAHSPSEPPIATVGADGADYTDIETALDSVENGVAIRVASGTYECNYSLLSLYPKVIMLQGGWDSEFGNHDLEKYKAILDGGMSGPIIRIHQTRDEATIILDGLNLMRGAGYSGAVDLSVFGTAIVKTSVVNCSFTESSSPSSGGILVLHNSWGSSQVDRTIANTLIAGNLGNGIKAFVGDSSTARWRILNSTIAENEKPDAAVDGISVFVTETAVLEAVIDNSIIWGNGGNDGEDIDLLTTALATCKFSSDYSDIGSTISSGGAIYNSGAFNINSDPLYADEGNYHLSSTSPCLGKGIAGRGPATDLDGRARPNPETGTVDIGCYEYYLPTPSPTPVDCSSIVEGFDDYNGGVRPPGWEFVGCDQDSDTYTAVGFYGVAAPSLALDDTGDRIVTKSFGPGCAFKLTFWLRGIGTGADDSILIEEYYAPDWNPVDCIQPIPTVGTVAGPYLLSPFISRVRFTYTKAEGDLAFDDVYLGSTTTAASTTTASTTSGSTTTSTTTAASTTTAPTTSGSTTTASTTTGVSTTSSTTTSVVTTTTVMATPTAPSPTPTPGECDSIVEGFDGFDGGVRPSGWEFVGCDRDSDTYTAAGYYGMSSPALALDGSGDRIVTKSFGPGCAFKLTFWLRGDGTGSSDSLLVEEYYAEAWSALGSLQPLPGTGTVAGPYRLSSLATRVRFTYTKAEGDLAFDDVYLGATTTGTTTTTTTTTTTVAASPTPVPPGPAAVGDYSGDGTSDIVLFRPSAGLWLVRGLTKAWFGASSDEVVPSDYNGDGTWEVAVFRPSNGKWLVRGVTSAFYGVSTDLPVPGDYNGDGSADVALFRPSIGKWLVRGGLQTYYGFSTDVLVPADYGGDGTMDIAVFRPSNGKWLVQGVTSAYYGFATDTVVPGDYTGDGAADIAVFRPSNGKWLVRGGPTAYFGNSSDTVQPADYDGDGTWDFAVFRSASGKWLVRGVTAPYYGSSTDHPVTNP